MTDAEKRDTTLRVVKLPDCCWNCRHYVHDQRCNVAEEENAIWPKRDNHCDLHERRDDDKG